MHSVLHGLGLMKKDFLQYILLIYDQSLHSLEFSSSCSFDYVAIYDGPSAASTLLVTICSGSNHVFTSSSHSMTVYFSSDNNTPERGFTAQYNAISASDSKSAKLLFFYLRI